MNTLRLTYWNGVIGNQHLYDPQRTTTSERCELSSGYSKGEASPAPLGSHVRVEVRVLGEMQVVVGLGSDHEDGALECVVPASPAEPHDA